MFTWYSITVLFIPWVIIGYITYLLYKWRSKITMFNHLPTPKYCLPIFGHSLRIPKDIKNVFDFHAKIFEETKSKIRVLWVSFLPFVGIYDVNIIENLLKSNSILTKGATYSFLSDWLGTGLLMSDGDKWKSRRRLLTPAFHFGILKANTPIISHHASVLVKHLKDKIEQDPNQEMQALLKSFSLATLCETAMGIRCNLYEKPEGMSDELMYVADVQDILELFLSRAYKPWLHNNFIYRNFSNDGKKYFAAVDRANKFVRNVIESRIKLLKGDTNTESSIFVDILIDSYKKNKIDIDGMLEEMNNFMFAGFDTVSAALAWLLFSIGKDQNIQNKLFDEIGTVEIDSLEKDAVNQLKYLDCVVKESLRLNTPAPIVSRYLKEHANLGGTLIPGGSTVLIHFYQLHRDKDVWENPTMFLPERFLNYNSSKTNPYAFVPFAAGPRNCIGQRFALLELKIAVIHLVKNFQFVTLQDEAELGVYSSAILRAGNGIWLKILHR